MVSRQQSREDSEIVDWSAKDLSIAIHSREVSCVEVMQAYLKQIEQHNPAVNAFVSLQNDSDLIKEAQDKDKRLSEALKTGETVGWMHGFPQAPKDLTETAGITTTSGSPILANFVPSADSIIVERMRAAGSIFVGKTNVPEFGLGSHTFNPVFGATKNSFDQTKSAGGSSGGAAVALALHMLPVADGSDFMGSLRNPAAWNNIFGFRPSAGRVPFGPAKDLFTQQFATEGPMGKSVADVSLLLSVIAGHDARAPLSILDPVAPFASPLERDFKGTRVGWLGDYQGYLATEPGVLDTCRNALGHFESLGCIIDEVSPRFSMESLWEAFLAIRATVVAGGLQEFYASPALRTQLKPEAILEVERGQKTSALQFFQASATRSAWYLEMSRLFDTFDYLVLPSAQVFPFDIESRWPKLINGREMDTYHRWMEVVIGPTLAGLPALSVPAGFDVKGRPAGLQIIAQRNADLAVLQLGSAYEIASRYTEIKSPLLADRMNP